MSEDTPKEDLTEHIKDAISMVIESLKAIEVVKNQLHKALDELRKAD